MASSRSIVSTHHTMLSTHTVVISMAVLLMFVVAPRQQHITSTTIGGMISFASATELPEFKYPQQQQGYRRNQPVYKGVYDPRLQIHQTGHNNDGHGGIIYNSDPLHPPPLVLKHYSLAQVCKEDLRKHCGGGGGRAGGGAGGEGLGLKSPYAQSAITCLNAYASELSPDCRSWHEARNTCSEQLHHAAAFHLEQQQQGDDRHGNDEDDLQKAIPKTTGGGGGGKGCSEACRTYCAEGGSLLMCMRTIGIEMKEITTKACYQSEFAKSVVRALRVHQQ